VPRFRWIGLNDEIRNGCQEPSVKDLDPCVPTAGCRRGLSQVDRPLFGKPSVSVPSRGVKLASEREPARYTQRSLDSVRVGSATRLGSGAAGVSGISSGFARSSAALLTTASSDEEPSREKSVEKSRKAFQQGVPTHFRTRNATVRIRAMLSPRQTRPAAHSPPTRCLPPARRPARVAGRTFRPRPRSAPTGPPTSWDCRPRRRTGCTPASRGSVRVDHGSVRAAA
jgi:hypothetical protein